MRTLLFLVAGLLFLIASVVLAKLFSSNYPAAPTWATIAFVAFWFVIAAGNMWVGVAKAGYSIGEELPIFLLIFALPAAVAIALKWKVL